MGILDKEPPVKGSLTIDLEKFPQEILNLIMEYARAGGMPILSVELPRIYMTDGVVLESSWEKSTITLEFSSNDITIKAP
jgi:hypothetical protein